MQPEITSHPDIGIAKLISAVAGAALSLKFVVGTWVEKIIMAIGGAFLSYYASTPVAAWMEAPKAEGLVGFLLGLFGMAVVSKVYEVIQSLDAKQAATDLWAAITKRIGG